MSIPEVGIINSQRCMFIKTSAGREEGEIAVIHYRIVGQS